MRRISIQTTGGRRGTRLCKPRHESGSSNGRSGLFSGIRKTSVGLPSEGEMRKHLSPIADDLLCRCAE
ncbi:hypothetical protein BHE74_00014439 [Ensete ventricosum]|nr:hypothetical protein BHE74_00014439 [Ensete ventricosum]